jgi:hypothetical protein
MIVDGYVSLKNRDALEEFRSHRKRLRQQLEAHKDVIGVDRTTELFDDDLRVIEAVLARL